MLDTFEGLVAEKPGLYTMHVPCFFADDDIDMAEFESMRNMLFVYVLEQSPQKVYETMRTAVLKARKKSTIVDFAPSEVSRIAAELHPEKQDFLLNPRAAESYWPQAIAQVLARERYYMDEVVQYLGVHSADITPSRQNFSDQDYKDILEGDFSDSRMSPSHVRLRLENGLFPEKDMLTTLLHSGVEISDTVNFLSGCPYLTHSADDLLCFFHELRILYGSAEQRVDLVDLTQHRAELDAVTIMLDEYVFSHCD